MFPLNFLQQQCSSLNVLHFYKWDRLTNMCRVQTYVWAPTLIIITVVTN